MMTETVEFLLRHGDLVLFGVRTLRFLVFGRAVAYAGIKYIQRHRLLRRLRIARISPEELRQMLDAGDPASIVDLRHSLALAERLEITPTQREALELGALLHDIGEIRTPEAVLQKAGPLTAEERRIVEQHPASGVDILETVPLLTPALDVVGGHHERFDGGGYPNGLRAEATPLTARIFAVVDALDAMTHERAYRSARPLPEALDELRREAGKQFDPRVVEAALAIPQTQWAELLGCPQRTEPTRVS